MSNIQQHRWTTRWIFLFIIKGLYQRNQFISLIVETCRPTTAAAEPGGERSGPQIINQTRVVNLPYVCSKVTLYSPGKLVTPGHSPWVCPFIISNPGASRQTGPFSRSPVKKPHSRIRSTFKKDFWYTVLLGGQHFREDAPENLLSSSPSRKGHF